MGYVSGPKLVTAVCNAGGLAGSASATMSVAELRLAIKETAAGTNGPFGVNIRADAPDAGERVAAVHVRGRSHCLFCPCSQAGADRRAQGRPGGRRSRRSERAGTREGTAWGVDAVIATGGEGGGHTGAVPTSLLIPQVVDAVDIPVIAAGGFFDGRGRVVALGDGAAGGRYGHPVPAHQ